MLKACCLQLASLFKLIKYSRKGRKERFTESHHYAKTVLLKSYRQVPFSLQLPQIECKDGDTNQETPQSVSIWQQIALCCIRLSSISPSLPRTPDGEGGDIAQSESTICLLTSVQVYAKRLCKKSQEVLVIHFW